VTKYTHRNSDNDACTSSCRTPSIFKAEADACLSPTDRQILNHYMYMYFNLVLRKNFGVLHQINIFRLMNACRQHLGCIFLRRLFSREKQIQSFCFPYRCPILFWLQNRVSTCSVDAGVMYASKCIEALKQALGMSGANVFENSRVTGIERLPSSRCAAYAPCVDSFYFNFVGRFQGVVIHTFFKWETWKLPARILVLIHIPRDWGRHFIRDFFR